MKSMKALWFCPHAAGVRHQPRNHEVSEAVKTEWVAPQKESSLLHFFMVHAFLRPRPSAVVQRHAAGIRHQPQNHEVSEAVKTGWRVAPQKEVFTPSLLHGSSFS
jgi:hypothetical protein